MTGPEAKVLSAIVKSLRRLQQQGERLWFVKLHGGPMQRAGLPDLAVCFRGRFIGLEVKEPRGVATPLQERELSMIGAAGGTACIVRSAEEAIDALFNTVAVPVTFPVTISGEWPEQENGNG